jgi:hypothetical protein
MSEPAPNGEPITILDLNSQPVPITSLWSNSHSRIIVVFVRHFLCMDCQDYFRAVWEAFLPRYQLQPEPAPRLVVIGSGSAKLARSLAEDIGAAHHPAFSMYTDPQCEAYTALGMTLQPEVSVQRILRNFWRALWQGVTRCWCACGAGSLLQNGGVFVMEGGSGKCLFSHVDQRPSDHADIETVLRAAGMPDKTATAPAVHLAAAE